MSMVVAGGVFRWHIGQIRVREGDRSKVFHWLTKESPIRPLLTSIAFSYPQGWTVEHLIPLDQSVRYIDDLQRKTLSMLGVVPLRAEEGLQVVDFVLPPEAPEVTS